MKEETKRALTDNELKEVSGGVVIPDSVWIEAVTKEAETPQITITISDVTPVVTPPTATKEEEVKKAVATP